MPRCRIFCLLGLSLVACNADGTTGASRCGPIDELTATEQSHFAELSGPYTLYAEEVSAHGDGTFVQGEPYSFTVACNGDATLTTAAEDRTFPWLDGGPGTRLEVFDHESNAFYAGDAYDLLWQFDRQEDAHVVSYRFSDAGQDHDWRFVETPTAARPPELSAADQLEADGLGAFLGATSFTVTSVRGGGGSASRVPDDFPFQSCDAISFNIDATLIASVTQTGDYIDPDGDDQRFERLAGDDSCDTRLQWTRNLDGDGFRRITAWVKTEGDVCRVEAIWVAGTWTPPGQSEPFPNEVTVVAEPSVAACAD